MRCLTLKACGHTDAGIRRVANSLHTPFPEIACIVVRRALRLLALHRRRGSVPADVCANRRLSLREISHQSKHRASLALTLLL